MTASATPAHNGATSALDLRTIKFDPRCALRYPPGLLVRRRMLPLLEWNGELLVAAAGTPDAPSLRFLQRSGGMPIRLIEAQPDSLRELQGRLFGNLNAALTQTRPPLEMPQSVPGGAKPARRLEPFATAS